MTEKEVFEFYNNKAKIIYVAVEARNNVLPIELLFEIHSAFDHLKQFHLGEEEEINSCREAISHLKRGALDGYKIVLRDFNNSYKKLIGIDASYLRSIDNGEFLPKMLKKRKEILRAAGQARLKEGIVDYENAFDEWDKTYQLVTQFEDEFFDHEKIDWAKAENKIQRKRALSKDLALGLVIGIIAGVVATLIYNIIFQIA